MGDWMPGDFHAAFVALFILLVAWFLTLISKYWVPAMSVSDGDEDRVRRTKAHHAFSMARDAVTMLTAALLVAYGGRANQAATNALAYVFMAVYLVAIIMAWFFRSKLVLTSLQALSFAIILALVIMAFATAVGR